MDEAENGAYYVSLDALTVAVSGEGRLMLF